MLPSMKWVVQCLEEDVLEHEEIVQYSMVLVSSFSVRYGGKCSRSSSSLFLN